MDITFFRNAAAKRAKLETLTKDELVDRIRTTTARTKEQLPWLKLARFGDARSHGGSLRHDENVVGILGVEIDYDGEQISFQEAAERLTDSGVDFVLYTSPSHTEERPRWRALFPLSTEMPPAERRSLAHLADEILGGVAASESFKLSQAYYFGSVQGQDACRWAWADGTFLDQWGTTIEGEDNPFIRASRMVDERNSIDVEARLGAMRYRAEGEEGIHATQLAVTASMLNLGASIDSVVSRVLAATQEVAPASWDWSREERMIRNMCTTWQGRLAREGQSRQAQVIQLDQRRPEREEEAPAARSSRSPRDPHVRLGKGIMLSLEDRGERLMFHDQRAWRYRSGLWQQLSTDEEKTWLDHEVEVGCEILGIASTQKIASETRAWLRRQPSLHREHVQWDYHGRVLTRSGMVDPDTGEIDEAIPEHWATRRIECSYDPRAEARWFLRMMNDSFQDDQPTVDLLQEVLGMALVERKHRALMRALILVGPPESGKSNILNTFAGMVSDYPITTPLDVLEGSHGTVGFLRNDPWLLHEAFSQTKWHESSTVKALLTGDHIHVNVKNGPMLQHQYRGPVFWGANVEPQFREASGAIRSRVLIVGCPARFGDGPAIGAAVEAHRLGYEHPSQLVLATEKSGILNWALEGYRRAVQRGRFQPTASIQSNLHELTLRSNMVAGFFENCVEFDHQSMVSVPDLCGAVSAWWQEERGEGARVPSNELIGRAVGALGDWRVVSKSHIRSRTKRYYVGVRLNDLGLEYWAAYSASRYAMDSGARIASRAEDVNETVPGEWVRFPEVAALWTRAALEASRTTPGTRTSEPPE